MKRVLFLLCLGVLASIIAVSCAQKLEPPTAPRVDTLVVHDSTEFFDTIIVYDTLPPHVDTILRYDTTYIRVHDTTYLPGDTVFVLHVDTLTQTYYDTTYVPVYIHDTTIVNRTDTLYIEHVIHDTTIVVQLDTVYQTDTLVVHDTISPGCTTFKFCQGWELNYTTFSTTIQLQNPAGTFLLGFNWTRLDRKPDSLEFAIKVNGEERFFTTYGKANSLIEWKGPFDLQENATVTLELRKAYYGGSAAKVASPDCYRYLKGCCFIGISVPKT